MNAAPKFESITKFAAAEEQLVTAIKLYFTDESPVAVHTLVRAAHEILDGICAHMGLERGVLVQGMNTIPPELKKRYINKINEARTFFKHASNPDGSIVWSSEVSTCFIMDAISLYTRITKDKTPCPWELLAFSLWFRVNNPELWEGSPPNEFDGLISDATNILQTLDRKEAYKVLMDASKRMPRHRANPF